MPPKKRVAVTKKKAVALPFRLNTGVIVQRGSSQGLFGKTVEVTPKRVTIKLAAGQQRRGEITVAASSVERITPALRAQLRARLEEDRRFKAEERKAKAKLFASKVYQRAKAADAKLTELEQKARAKAGPARQRLVSRLFRSRKGK